MKNLLTLIGGIMAALGPVFIHSATNSALWYVGLSLSAVGPVLIASRGLFETNQPKP